MAEQRYSQEVRERAVRMVFEQEGETALSGRRSVDRWEDRLHGGGAAQVGPAGRGDSGGRPV